MDAKKKFKLESRINRLSQKYGALHRKTLGAKSELAHLTNDHYAMRMPNHGLSKTGSWLKGLHF